MCIGNEVCLYSTLCVLSICMCILHIVFCTVCKYVLSICKKCCCCCFFTVWSTLVRISLTKALVLWWCDSKSDLIWLVTYLSYCTYYIVLNIHFKKLININFLIWSRWKLCHCKGKRSQTSPRILKANFFIQIFFIDQKVLLKCF